MLSNQLNFTLADAYFAADKAAHQYEMYHEKKDKLEEYEELYDDLYGAQTKASEEKSITQLAGQLIGAGIGAYLGGPKGAMAGYQLGGGGAEFLYEVRDDLGLDNLKDNIEDLRDDIENFDWDLGQSAGKFNYLADEQWVDKMEATSKQDAKDSQYFIDNFYNPWYQDLVSDIVFPVVSQAVANEAFGDKLSDLGDDIMNKATSWLSPDSNLFDDDPFKTYQSIT